MTPPTFPDALPADALDRAHGDMPVIPFDPVPRLRQRRKGWDEARQRAFIAALSRCASVAAAAREVGMTARSAYRLADAPGADSFVMAWDAAIELGMAAMRFHGLDRCLNGDFVPVYRRGKLVQVEHRHNNRLAIAILGGREATADDLRRTALMRREHRLDLAALDKAREENKRIKDEADAALRAEIDRLIDGIHEKCRRGPRVTLF